MSYYHYVRSQGTERQSWRERVVVMVWSVVIGGGIGLLIGLAVLIGQLQAQEAAWRAIARERRDLVMREREMAAALQAWRCPNCGRDGA